MRTTDQHDVIKTAVIEDIKDIRDGLATLINFTEGFHCTGSYRSMEVASRVIKFFREFHNPEREDYQLTPHETRVLKLLTEGYNYQTAAEKLGVSYNTM